MSTEQTVPTVSEVQAALLANVEPDAWRGGRGPGAGGILSRVRSALKDGAKLDSKLIERVYAEFSAYKSGVPARLAEEINELESEIAKMETRLRSTRRALAEKQAKLSKLGNASESASE